MGKRYKKSLQEQGFEKKTIFQFLRERVTPMHRRGRPKNYGLAPASKRLLNWLKRRGENGRWIGGQSEIARALRIHPRTVRKAVADLEKHGYVRRIQEPGIKYGIQVISNISLAGKRPKNHRNGPVSGPEKTQETALKSKEIDAINIGTPAPASKRPKNEPAAPMNWVRIPPRASSPQPQYVQPPSLTQERAEALVRKWLQENRYWLSPLTTLQSLKISWVTGQEPAKSFPPAVQRAAELLWGKFGRVV